jgi:ammonia channel protein AmtB
MNSSDSSKLSRARKSETRELAHGAIGSARVTAFGVSNVAPSGAVVGGLVIVVGYAGFAAPLVVLIALVASLCRAVSIAEFARRLPSADSLYTYNSRGLAGIVAGMASRTIVTQKAPGDAGPRSLIARQDGTSRWTSQKQPNRHRRTGST